MLGIYDRNISYFVYGLELTIINFTVCPMRMRRLAVKLLRLIFSIKVGVPNCNLPVAVQERQPGEC